MWAILLNILRFGGTAAAGWAISDWFNEKNATKQAQAQPKTFGQIVAENWFKWVVMLVGVGIVGLLISKFLKNKN